MDEKQLMTEAMEYADKMSKRPDKEPMDAALPIFFVSAIAVTLFSGFVGMPDDELAIPFIVATFLPAGFVYFIKTTEWKTYHEKHTSLFQSELDRLREEYTNRD